MIKPYLTHDTKKFTTLDGGSLGSWVEEDRGEMRELMVIAKFSRDSIDMSNAHCGDCLAGATESIYVCARECRVCTAAHPLTLALWPRHAGQSHTHSVGSPTR